MPPRHPEVPVPPPEEIAVRTTRVACDGDGGALGHPLVYLDMGDETAVECGYCDRRFVLASAGDYHDPSPRHDAGH